MSPTRKPRCLVCTRARKSRGLCQKHYMQLRAVKYDATKAPFWEQVKNIPGALELLTGQEVAVTPLVPKPPTPTVKEHDAWLAMYAYCRAKDISVDAFLTGLLLPWYETTFPALAKGSPEAVTLQAH
jgi:hypothetical protein